MCDRQQQLALWRAGYAAGRAHQAAVDQAAILEGARAYQELLLRQLIDMLAVMLGEHAAAKTGIKLGAGPVPPPARAVDEPAALAGQPRALSPRRLDAQEPHDRGPHRRRHHRRCPAAHPGSILARHPHRHPPRAMMPSRRDLRFSTHPLCDGCWYGLNPHRTPYRIAADHREAEACCRCGAQTRSGIYYWADPASMPACRGHTEPAD